MLAGLRVITTPELGDYSQLIVKEKLGVVYNDENDGLKLEKTTFEEKKRLSRFAIHTFTKEAYKQEYQKIIALNE